MFRSKLHSKHTDVQTPQVAQAYKSPYSYDF